MDILNIINPSISPANKRAWDCTMQGISAGRGYKQTASYLIKEGFYIPEDQYKALETAFTIQMDLDIGSRYGERT